MIEPLHDFTKGGYSKLQKTFLLFILLIIPVSAQMIWKCVTDSAPWIIDGPYSSVVFNNNMWVIGNNPDPEGIWKSSNGCNWECVTDTSPMRGYTSFSSVVYNNSI
jgi:hypothetical protein